MSRHRLGPASPRHARTKSGRRRKATRSSGRIVAAGSAAAVTAIALLGASGIISINEPAPSASAETVGDSLGSPTSVVNEAVDIADDPAAGTSTDDTLSKTLGQPPADAPAEPAREAKGKTKTAPKREEAAEEFPADRVPEDSGTGRRAIFSETAQRVWLVNEDEEVERSYLVSGSLTDNLHPGTYEVYSRSEQAWGIDDSGTMEWFVRFTRGENAAIGFHNIPVNNGRKVQTRAELGTPQSHGCIRQAEPDALAMWEFAQLGTTVVVI